MGRLDGRLVAVVHTGVGDTSAGRARLHETMVSAEDLRGVVSAGYAGGTRGLPARGRPRAGRKLLRRPARGLRAPALAGRGTAPRHHHFPAAGSRYRSRQVLASRRNRRAGGGHGNRMDHWRLRGGRRADAFPARDQRRRRPRFPPCRHTSFSTPRASVRVTSRCPRGCWRIRAGSRRSRASCADSGRRGNGSRAPCGCWWPVCRRAEGGAEGGRLASATPEGWRRRHPRNRRWRSRTLEGAARRSARAAGKGRFSCTPAGVRWLPRLFRGCYPRLTASTPPGWQRQAALRLPPSFCPPPSALRLLPSAFCLPSLALRRRAFSAMDAPFP